MEAFSGWFTGKSVPDKEPQATVLSDWKSYQSKTGVSSQSTSSKLLSSAEEGAASLGKAASGAFSSVAAASNSVVEGVQSVPGTSQYVYFAAFAGVGVFLLLLSFFVFLPIIILRPSKFAITFSLGSALILLSLGFLKGWKAMFGHLSSKERLPPTAAYLGSLLGTMYAALIMHSYIYSLVLCVVQVAALVYYVASFFPGGAQGAQYVFSSVASGSFSVGKAVLGGMLSSSK